VIDVYARLSYAANGETVKVDDQVEMGEEAIDRRGAEVGRAFRDNSLSAWRPGVVRPEWDELMARLESGESDGVWVYDLTRFSRKVAEGERLVELAARGIRVWAMAGEYDLTTADGRRAFREAMVAAAAESDKISERVKRGKLRRARKGRPTNAARSYAMPGYLPLGKDWEPGDPRVMVSPERLAAERAVVRECYARLLAGEPLSALVKDLNARAVPDPTGTQADGQAAGRAGGRWTRGYLTRMLQRPALAGLLAHNGEIIGELAGADPVVSREEWERLCSVFAGRRRGRPAGQVSQRGYVHVLSGLITCGSCGHTLRGRPRGNPSPPYPDGAPRREYRCIRSADHAGCGRNHIDARAAEQAVDEAMRTRLGDPRRAARMAEHLSRVDAERAKLAAEIATLEQAADELVTKTAAWGLERVDKAMTPILARLETLQAARAALQGPEHADVAAADAVAAWDEARDRDDHPTMRSMIKRTFPRLTLTPSRRHNDHSPDRFDWNPAPSATSGPSQRLVTDA
jgi:site-specific DNA recombinase